MKGGGRERPRFILRLAVVIPNASEESPVQRTTEGMLRFALHDGELSGSASRFFLLSFRACEESSVRRTSEGDASLRSA